MPNQYVNKVTKSDGTTLIDITDTTALASHVSSGRYFYLATGEKATGTATGGSDNGSVWQDEDGYVVLDDEPGVNVSIAPLSVSTNGTYTAPSGVAYSPVTVSVPSGAPTLQSKSVTPTKSVQTVVPDSGYDGLSAVEVEAIPSTYIVPEGMSYITSNGTYDVGSYASAFVSVDGGGGGGYTIDDIVTRTISGEVSGSATFIAAPLSNLSITKASFPNCSWIAGYAFASCSQLETVYLPSCTRLSGNYTFQDCHLLSNLTLPLISDVGAQAFQSCRALTKVEFSSCISTGSSAFRYATNLSFVSLIRCSYIGNNTFMYCSSLNTVILSHEFSSVGWIRSSAFCYCTRLLSLYLLASVYYQLSYSANFISTPIYGYTADTDGQYGSIFVPESLYSKYATENPWSYYYNLGRIVSLTDEQIQNVLDYGTHET